MAMDDEMKVMNRIVSAAQDNWEMLSPAARRFVKDKIASLPEETTPLTDEEKERV